MNEQKKEDKVMTRKLFILLLAGVVLFSFSQKTTAMELQTGDIIVFGYSARGPEDLEYSAQMYLGYFSSIGKKSGLYEPLWGDLKTWDDTSYPMGKRCFWGHIEVVTEDNYNYHGVDGEHIVVLRLTEETKANSIDVNEVVDAYTALMANLQGMDQPFLGALIYWIKKAHDEELINWLGGDLFERWTVLYEVDFNLLPYPTRFQTFSTTDLSDPEFFKRSNGCSSMTGWALVFGWYKKVPAVREVFLNNLESMAAVDCFTPGQVAWFLVEKDLATIVAKLPALEN